MPYAHPSGFPPRSPSSRGGVLGPLGPKRTRDVFFVARTMARDRPSPYGEGGAFFARSAGACPPRSLECADAGEGHPLGCACGIRGPSPAMKGGLSANAAPGGATPYCIETGRSLLPGKTSYETPAFSCQNSPPEPRRCRVFELTSERGVKMSVFHIIDQIDRVLRDKRTPRQNRIEELQNLAMRCWSAVIPEYGTEAFRKLDSTEVQQRWTCVRGEVEKYDTKSQILYVLDWPASSGNFYWTK